jgi:hypothetical protein
MLSMQPTKDPQPLIVIARKLPDGGVEIRHGNDGRHFCTFSWDRSDKPDYRHRYITLNCFKYHIMWDKPLRKE